LYLAIGIIVGIYFGFWWAIVAVVALSLSFFASVRLIEAEAGLLNSMLSILRLARLGSDVDELRAARTTLVARIRALAERLADPDVPRMFTDKDFSQPGDD
jgi:hypothetical protein